MRQRAASGEITYLGRLDLSNSLATYEMYRRGVDGEDRAIMHSYKQMSYFKLLRSTAFRWPLMRPLIRPTLSISLSARCSIS